MALVPCGINSTIEYESTVMSNKIFCVKLEIQDNSYRSEGLHNWSPKTKRRKLESAQGKIQTKKDVSLKSSESVVITCVRAVPQTFIDTIKEFSVILSWEVNDEDTTGQRRQQNGSSTNLRNASIGSVFLTVEDIVSSRLEIKFDCTPGWLVL